jgi:hypothetical protein
MTRPVNSSLQTAVAINVRAQHDAPLFIKFSPFFYDPFSFQIFKQTH